jgi:putative phosphoribosyl transferase
VFRDRVDAGQQLAELLDGFRSPVTVALGIPRGGVVVAAEVARHLHAPLDVVVTRKLGSPYHPEYAVGAIGEGGVRIVDDAAVRASHIDADALRDVEKAERVELARRTTLFRGGRTRRDLTGSLAVVVDDGARRAPQPPCRAGWCASWARRPAVPPTNISCERVCGALEPRVRPCLPTLRYR